MGLFNKKEKYDIVPDLRELKERVCTYYSGRRGVININSKLVVPTGYLFITGKNGHVLDRFSEGEHFFYYSNLPYACRKYKFNKKREGKMNEKFYCQYYFINKGLMPGQFKTYRKVVMGTKAYGIYKMNVYGMFSYRVIDCLEFLQSLLNEYDYIKTGEAEDLVNYWVGEVAVNVLEKNNFIISDVLNNNPIIAEKIRISVESLFKKIGAELVDFKIYKYDLPKEVNIAQNQKEKKSKKLKKESDEMLISEEKNQEDFISEENSNIETKILNSTFYEENNNKSLIITNSENFYKDNIKQNEDIENSNVNLSYNNEAIINNESKIKQEDLSFLENTNIKNVDKLESYPQTESVKKPFEYKPFGSFVIKDEKNSNIFENCEQSEQSYTHNEENLEFIDLENIYKSSAKNVKRCYNCGAENNIDAINCVLCGNNLDKGGMYE